MKKLHVWMAVLCLSLGVVAGSAHAGQNDVEVIEIQVAPQMLLLSSYQGGEVTVHADIPLSVVACFTLELNGLQVSWTKADACGNLVAKFDEAAVKGIVEPPSVTLTLTGSTLGGEPFTGSDTVRVKP